ncbi:MAG: hypothetical protein ABIT08_16820 [Bacteroidia bacterium]
MNLYKTFFILIGIFFGILHYSTGQYNVSPAGGINVVYTGLFVCSNLGINALNINQINNKSENNTLPIIGLITGASEIAVGFHGLSIKEEYPNIDFGTLSNINFGLGTVTIILSTINLISPKRKKQSLISWNFCSIKTFNNYSIHGIRMSRRF